MVSVTHRRAALSIAVAAVAGPLLGAIPALAGAPPLAAPAPRLVGPAPGQAQLAGVALGHPHVAGVAPPLAVPALGQPRGAAPARQPQPGGGAPEQPDGEQPPPPPGVVFVEVRPGTVEPGFLVGVRASCHDNSVPAIVVSDAFGRIAVHPQRGLLTAAPMVRERTRPGNYRVKLECPDGATASTMLQVVKAVKPTRQPRPSRGPATGFGGAAGSGATALLLPGGLALTIAGVTVGMAAARRSRTGRGVARR